MNSINVANRGFCAGVNEFVFKGNKTFAIGPNRDLIAGEKWETSHNGYFRAHMDTVWYKYTAGSEYFKINPEIPELLRTRARFLGHRRELYKMCVLEQMVPMDVVKYIIGMLLSLSPMKPIEYTTKCDEFYSEYLIL